MGDLDHDRLLDFFTVSFDRYSWSLYLQAQGGEGPQPRFLDRTNLLPQTGKRNTSVDVTDASGDGFLDTVLVAGYDGVQLLAVNDPGLYGRRSVWAIILLWW